MKHMEANKHKSGHHYHKNEMEHHKMRDKHKSANRSLKASEHEHHPGLDEHHAHKMVGGDVNDNHQQGIARKIQKPGSMDVGQHGSMSAGWTHERHSK